MNAYGVFLLTGGRIATCCNILQSTTLGSEAIMSVRKRSWLTKAELAKIDPEAKRLARVAGKESKWKDYLEKAGAALGIKPREA